MAKINLPTHVARGLFFALRHAHGVRRGPIRNHGHHGLRRSVFERLGPRVRRSAANGSHGRFSRLFDSAIRGIQKDARRGRQASSHGLRPQRQPPSARRGVDGYGPSNTGATVVEAPAPTVAAEPVAAAPALPVYAPMEPMSPALATPAAPPRYWCDFCKEFSSIPHTLDFSGSLPSPTPVAPTPVAGSAPLDPWYLKTQAAPALDAVKAVDEAAGLGSGNSFNTAARTGFSPFFLDMARPSTPPLAMRTDAPANMKEKAPPVAPPTMAEGSATTPPTIRRLLGRRVAAVDRRPGIRRGSWNPAALGLPSAEVLNASSGSGFYSPDEGESSSN